MLLNMDPLFNPDAYALERTAGNPAKLLLDVDLQNLAFLIFYRGHRHEYR